MTDYFCFVSSKNNCFEVVSKNTNHCWCIKNNISYYQLYHAHCASNNYHLHGEFSDIFDCVLEIVNHDEWLLNIWRNKHKGKIKQPKTYFDELLEKYN